MRRRRVRWRRLQTSLTARAVTTVYRRTVLVASSAASLRAPELSSRLPVTMRWLQNEEVEAYLRLRPDQGEAEIRARLASGHRCSASWLEGAIVDVCWVATGRGPVPYLRGCLSLAPGDLFIYDSFTAPGRRGWGLYAAKVTHVFHASRRDGFQRNLAIVAIENRGPLMILKRLGARWLGYYHALRLGPWHPVWARPLAEEPLPPFQPERRFR